MLRTLKELNRNSVHSKKNIEFAIPRQTQVNRVPTLA